MRTKGITDYYDTLISKDFTELMNEENKFLSKQDKEMTNWNNQSKSIVYVLQETEYRTGDTYMHIWRAEGFYHADLIVKTRQSDNIYRERFITFTTFLQYPYSDECKADLEAGLYEPRFVLRMQNVLDRRQNDMTANPQTMRTKIASVKIDKI